MSGHQWAYPLIVVMGLCSGTVVGAGDDTAALRDEVSQLKLQLDEAMAKLEAAEAGDKVESKPMDAAMAQQLMDQQRQLQQRVELLLERVDSLDDKKINSPFAYRNEGTESPGAVNAIYTRYDTGQSSESYVPPQPAPRTRGPVVYVEPTKNYYYTSYTPAYYRGYYGSPYWGGYRPSYRYYRGCFPYSSVSFGYYHGGSHLRYSTGVSFGSP